MKYENIPHSCPHGHTEQDLKSAGIDWDKFQSFMRGQTVMICDGSQWDPETNNQIKSRCFENPHGTVYYGCDVRRFLFR